ncbi:signal transducer and activator of transcription 6 [Hyla sarda]|uniref:signal transducer and activator of transcription 6 n=1 Tax=Hyla sarda TaxID=327740 RepID=UPI0024C28BC3|nr:signal transducer and activator of transcription 6 [Hyla sarda]XP_056418493.1 signal transducer and activator of transcription 6 [Hyla sarda]
MAKAPSVWSYVSKMSQEHFESLYGGFPQKVRHHLGDWLENQPWEHMTRTDPFCIELANSVLTKLVEELEKVAKSCGSDAHMVRQWVENLKTRAQHDPMSIIQPFRNICKGEVDIVLKQYPRLSSAFQSRQEEVMFNFRRMKMKHILEKALVAQQTLKLALENVQLHPQVQDLSSLQTNFKILLEESLNYLSTLQEQTVKRINIWKRQQQLAGNGAAFDENLLPLQDRVEFVFGIYIDLYPIMQELKKIDQRLVPQDIFDQINTSFGALIKSSFLVDKQPPQVLKTQTKFQASVNFMLGPTILTGVGKMPDIRATIITEKRAQELCLASGTTSDSFNDGAGEIENGKSVFEFTQATRTCGAVFKNMLLKKIKRCERKGSESVTEEKCAILFTAVINFSGSTYIIQALSLPVVVIVHGNQDNNAKATILWDNAFSEIGRRPFYVHEKVPWKKMCATLNMKFMSEVGTKHELSKENFWFLAQKIFGDNCISCDDLNEQTVSWAQFNKEPLRERTFTFWQWFDGVVDLTKKHLKEYWSDGLIMGFASKQYVHKLLSSEPSGTFLLRFSDSEIGGITIAHVIRGEDGSGQIQNIQPFGTKDLQILTLGDRVKDLKQLAFLYQKGRKDDVFKKYYKNVSNCSSGYKKTEIVVKVVGDETEDSQTSWNNPIPMDGIENQQPSTSRNVQYPSPVYASPVGSPVHIPTPQPVYSHAMPTLIQSPPYPIEPTPFPPRYVQPPVYQCVDNSNSPQWIPTYVSETSFTHTDGLQTQSDLFELLKIIENDSNMPNISHFSPAIINDPTPMQGDFSWTN